VLHNPIKLANDETFFSFMFNDSRKVSQGTKV
jgi:hypothetical protein